MEQMPVDVVKVRGAWPMVKAFIVLLEGRKARGDSEMGRGVVGDAALVHRQGNFACGKENLLVEDGKVGAEVSGRQAVA